MQIFDIAPGVACFPLGFVNAYGIQTQEGAILVDTGMALHADALSEAFIKRYGSPAKAIVLTHGHQDHSGGARALAEKWGVKVYVHRLERPYLVGKSRYPAPDPSIGGPLAFLSRFSPWPMMNLTGVLESLPDDGTLPGAEGWTVIPASGHSPGQIALWNEKEKVILAGDSLATADFDTYSGMFKGLVLHQSDFFPAGAPFTCNWIEALATVQKLADLEATAIGPGHGEPLVGPNVPKRMRHFASHFRVPADGRYVRQPATVSETGVESIPPPNPDNFKRNAAVAGAVLGFVLLLLTRLVSVGRGKKS